MTRIPLSHLGPGRAPKRRLAGGIATQDISLAKRGLVRQDVWQICGSSITICRVKTLTIRTDAEVEQALESLTRDGQSRSEATRAAILAAERAHRRALLRAEAEQLRNDPDDVSASRELAAEMDAIRAW